nr:hypothetical protein CFP56_39438 [Quercus suber]
MVTLVWWVWLFGLIAGLWWWSVVGTTDFNTCNNTDFRFAGKTLPLFCVLELTSSSLGLVGFILLQPQQPTFPSSGFSFLTIFASSICQKKGKVVLKRILFVKDLSFFPQISVECAKTFSI